jgi:hypothetical protein
MPDYSQSKIYKIYSDDTDLIYYGSTVQPLFKRLYSHKTKCNSKKYISCTCKVIFEQSDNVKIVLVESFPCKTKEELHQREFFYIQNNRCVNKVQGNYTTNLYKVQRVNRPIYNSTLSNKYTKKDYCREYNRWMRTEFGSMCRMYKAM